MATLIQFNLSRRGFMAGLAATGSLRAVPVLSVSPAATPAITPVLATPGRRLLTLVWDRDAGAMRAIDRVVS